ncbi:flagellar filament capping protein FliD [Paraburkholderia flava]|uniref:flagellar filament capping protein FliD n=1 Tax=Paraburkholderia flava TaxID=2547393 RepID=UPI0010619382|nr:flagellar filament capping protein FliD [Paraburkholderia flava]
MATTTPTSSTDLSTALAQAAQSIISGATKSTLDVNQLVSTLVTAKTAAQNAAITNKQGVDNTELTAVGQLKSVLSALETAVSGLSDGTALSAVSATVTGTAITAAAAKTGATPGTSTIDVNTVASADKYSSTGFTSSTTVGTGTLTLSLGSSGTMSVNVDSTNNSITGIAAAINASSNNPGITATVVNGSDGQHLVLTSNSTGAANTVSMTASSGLNSALNTSNMTELQKAQDASLTVDGSPVTSSTNTITGVLNGITINLTPAAAGTSQTLTVATDTTAQTTAITNFVTAYNNYVTTAKSLSSYDSTAAAGSQAGPLLGDSMLNSITNGLASIVSGGISSGGSTFSLASIGLNLQDDGTIVTDTTALQNALTTNPGSVSALFNQTNGMGTLLNNFSNVYVQTSGTIDQRTAAINSDLSSLADQASTLQTYSSTLTAQYNAQFSALNNLLTTTQNNTQYLDQLFGGNGAAGTLNKSS